MAYIFIRGNLSYKTLEGGLPHKKLGGLLVAADLTQSHRPGAIAVGFLDSSRFYRLSSALGGELLAWGLASSRFAGGLLGSRHCSLLRLLGSVWHNIIRGRRRGKDVLRV